MADTDTPGTLSTLNDHLHTQLSRLCNAQTTGDKLKEEIERTRAITSVANNIINNGRLVLEAQRTLGGSKGTPAMLGIESK